MIRDIKSGYGRFEECNTKSLHNLNKWEVKP